VAHSLFALLAGRDECKHASSTRETLYSRRLLFVVFPTRSQSNGLSSLSEHPAGEDDILLFLVSVLVVVAQPALAGVNHAAADSGREEDADEDDDAEKEIGGSGEERKSSDIVIPLARYIAHAGGGFFSLWGGRDACQR